eukprot:7551578-Alexandrium_andersonii.AAC.1
MDQNEQVQRGVPGEPHEVPNPDELEGRPQMGDSRLLSNLGVGERGLAFFDDIPEGTPQRPH